MPRSLRPLLLALGLLAAPSLALAGKGAAPVGFQELVVDGIAGTPVGPAVVLTNGDRSVLLPIWVGDTEAATISLRQAEQAAPRPLTHDLLDQAIEALGGEITEVRLDALDQHTFTAQVTLKPRKAKAVILDARASDAIALALGHDVPIWVAQAVVDEAGLAPEALVNPPDGPQPVAPEVPL